MKCVSILQPDQPVVTVPPQKRRLTICAYIDACPQCSCSECEGVYVGREAGKILCCTEHMFTKEEVAMARKFAPPIRVMKE